MTETRVITGAAGGIGQLLRAALPTVPVVNQLPGIKRTSRTLPDLVLRTEQVAVDPEHVRRYAEVCGFARSDALPPTYLHMLCFPLHMAVMSDSEFPFPAIGTVHLENRIERLAHLGPGAVVDASVHATNLRTHANGTAYDMVASVSADGVEVWRSTSTYLRVGKGDRERGDRGTEFGEPVPGVASWRLPSSLGRTYARVSGDSNPIHLHPLTARAFGFPRHIAHGMWTKARALAALDNRLPEQVRVEVGFKKPIFLPGTVAFGFRGAEDGIRFSVTDPRKGAPHVVGRTTPL